MRGRVHHFDPSRLQATAKFIDYEYAPKTVVVPATSVLRKPLPGRIWHDKACVHRLKRRFSAHKVQFAVTVARRIDNPLLAQEMIVFGKKKMYLDTSIELQYLPKLTLPVATQRCAEAISK